MTFTDILKSSFLEKASTYSLTDTAIALAVAFAIGLFILFVYRKTFTGVMYSAGFAVSILAMTLITSVIILAVTSNVILSLGMVGALSIVRFRTAVKEPLDIAFVFWAISAGIVVGAGLIPLAVVGSAFIGLILLLFVSKNTSDVPYIIVVTCDGAESEAEAMNMISGQTKKHMIKSKTVSRSGVELTVEVRLADASARLINDLLKIEGVSNACMVSFNGEYMGQS